MHGLLITLLQDVPIMHWDGSGVRGSAVQHEACGSTVSKAAVDQVKVTYKHRDIISLSLTHEGTQPLWILIG